MITVTQAAPAQGPPKKCDDRSFFDVSILFNGIKFLLVRIIDVATG